MSDTRPALAASPALRTGVALLGLLMLAAGLAYGVATLQALRELAAYDAGVWSGFRPLLYLLLWLLFCLSAVWSGAAMLRSAQRGVRRDVVPGPPLYFAGLSLVGVGLFLLTSGALARGSLASVLGMVLLVAEYRSDTL